MKWALRFRKNTTQELSQDKEMNTGENNRQKSRDKKNRKSDRDVQVGDVTLTKGTE